MLRNLSILRGNSSQDAFFMPLASQSGISPTIINTPISVLELS